MLRLSMGEFFVLAFVVALVNGARDSSGHNRKGFRRRSTHHMLVLLFFGLAANILHLHGLVLLVLTCPVLALQGLLFNMYII